MSLEKKIIIEGLQKCFPIIQAGMGAYISGYLLAVAAQKAGCVGTLSSVGLDQFTRARLLANGEEVKDVSLGKMDFVEAVRREVAGTKREGGGITAINIMCALVKDYEASVKGAVEGGVDIIISGAGLPIDIPGFNHAVDLPFLVEKYAGKNHNIKLVPIVSSGSIFNKIYTMWEKQGHVPDAAVVEGPRAGGHLGWSYKRIIRAHEAFLKGEGPDFLTKYDLFDVLLPEVLASATKDGRNVPIIAAGGIPDHSGIVRVLDLGAVAAQIGTRFAATYESGASKGMKQSYIDATPEDIAIAMSDWGSPCNFPFRYLKKSPLAQEKNREYFCICPGLLNATDMDIHNVEGRCPQGYVQDFEGNCPAKGLAVNKAIYTCGTEVYRIDKIGSVQELVNELVG